MNEGLSWSRWPTPCPLPDDPSYENHGRLPIDNLQSSIVLICMGTSCTMARNIHCSMAESDKKLLSLPASCCMLVIAISFTQDKLLYIKNVCIGRLEFCIDCSLTCRAPSDTDECCVGVVRWTTVIVPKLKR